MYDWQRYENNFTSSDNFYVSIMIIFKRTDRGASTSYFKNFCPCPHVIWFVSTITLESLNQSEPNFHTWLLSRQPRPSLKMSIAGHMWPPPPSKLTYLWFQPIQTKFPYVTFDWNSSSEFKNGHHRSNVTSPLIGGLLPHRKMFVDTITLERLNQSEPNLHRWLLTGIAQPSLKMGIAGHMQPS